MSLIKDLILLALESEDREDMYRAFHAILTSTDKGELVAALSIADPIFKLAINARIDQLALEQYLAEMVEISQQQTDLTENLIADRDERAPKSRTGFGLGKK